MKQDKLWFLRPLKNGLTAEIPSVPKGVNEFAYLRKLRHGLLWGQAAHHGQKGYCNSVEYDYSRKVMRQVNKRLYEITGNDMYIWLSGDFDELKKIEDGKN